MTPTDPTRPLSASEEAHEREDWAGWIYSTCQLRGHPAQEHWHPPVGQVPSERAALPPAALREALRAALPKAVNFRIVLAAPVGAPVWDQIADDLRAALSPAPTPVEPPVDRVAEDRLANWLEQAFGPDVSAANHPDPMTRVDWLNMARAGLAATKAGSS